MVRSSNLFVSMELNLTNRVITNLGRSIQANNVITTLQRYQQNISFCRSEADPKYHGTGGPLGVLEGRDYPEISKIFLEAGEEMGYKVCT